MREPAPATYLQLGHTVVCRLGTYVDVKVSFNELLLSERTAQPLPNRRLQSFTLHAIGSYQEIGDFPGIRRGGMNRRLKIPSKDTRHLHVRVSMHWAALSVNDRIVLATQGEEDSILCSSVDHIHSVVWPSLLSDIQPQ
jgi:hypothetical protein